MTQATNFCYLPRFTKETKLMYTKRLCPEKSLGDHRTPPMGIHFVRHVTYVT